jgi:murein L,D-transpeptidase YafK
VTPLRIRFALLLALGACSAGGAPVSQPDDAPVDRIIIDKTRRTLTLERSGRPDVTYRNIALGDAPKGHKQFEGDERTPEGDYAIDGRNAGSRYYRSLRISYPNAADRARAVRAGRSPGGDIFIHGQPNGAMLARIPRDWTDGCVALSNTEMDVLWRRVRIGTKVRIIP